MSNIGERRIFPALVCNAPTGQKGSEREMISTLSISLYYVTYPKTTAVTRWRRKETGYTQNKGNCLQTSIVQKAHIFIRQNLQKPMPNIPTSQLRFHVFVISHLWKLAVSSINPELYIDRTCRYSPINFCFGIRCCYSSQDLRPTNS